MDKDCYTCEVCTAVLGWLLVDVCCLGLSLGELGGVHSLGGRGVYHAHTRRTSVCWRLIALGGFQGMIGRCMCMH